VRAELRRYEHPLLDFGVEETPGGGLDLVIRLRDGLPAMSPYRAALHARDIAGSNFAWTFQRLLYDCLHDYLVEMFVRTPQDRRQV
jgi:hypothetical protein